MDVIMYKMDDGKEYCIFIFWLYVILCDMIIEKGIMGRMKGISKRRRKIGEKEYGFYYICEYYNET